MELRHRVSMRAVATRFMPCYLRAPRHERGQSEIAMKVGASNVRRLTRAQLPRDTLALARFLIGKIVVRALPEGLLAGRIVETEAYIQGDAACHAVNGMTPRNRSLFLRHGHAYVYLAYGTSW